MKKKLLSVLLALFTMMYFVPMNVLATDESIEINETNFPDQKFREYVKTLDGGDDGVFTPEELQKITEIEFSRERLKIIRRKCHMGKFDFIISMLNISEDMFQDLSVSKKKNIPPILTII